MKEDEQTAADEGDEDLSCTMTGSWRSCTTS